MDVEHELRRLEQANQALRQANARLARGLVGSSGSAAASLLARLERAERELARARADADRKQSRLEELQVELAAASRVTDLLETELRGMRETRTWRLAGRYWSLRDRLLRRGGAL